VLNGELKRESMSFSQRSRPAEIGLARAVAND
jgi:hypothetical protein